MALVSDGSDGVETAIKIARQAQIQKGFPYRHKIVSMQYSYHGATLGAMSVEGPQAPIAGAGYIDMYKAPGTRQAYNCDCASCPLDLTYPDCNLLCAENIRDIIEFENPETVAAVMLCPVPICPHTAVPPADYLARVREICDEHGVYLICDEVINGFGRTGKMFAVEHWNIVPDILCLSKGISSGYVPLAATLATEEVYSHFNGDPTQVLHHGHTYSAHPVTAAVALKNIEIIERENLVENSATMGKVFYEGLKALEEKHPIVYDVQGIGLMLGLALRADKKTPALLDAEVFTRIAQLMYAKGFWTMVFYITPPLTITEEEVHASVQAFDEPIGQACAEFGL